MKPSRGSALAALVLVAIAAPVTAYAVAGDDGDDSGRPAGHGSAKTHDKPDGAAHATGKERADEASAAGRAHAEAMKAWARCVADAASGAKADDAARPPKLTCGDKPVPPGRAKHATDAAPGRSGDHRPPSGHGHGHTD